MVKTTCVLRVFLLVVVPLFFYSNCGQSNTNAPQVVGTAEFKAVAELDSMENNTATGVVLMRYHSMITTAPFKNKRGSENVFRPKDYMTVTTNMTGFKHGHYNFYIDQIENCGDQYILGPKAVNLGTFSSDDEGRIRFEITLKLPTLRKNGSHSIIGKAVIVQTNNENGDQVACGMIRTGNSRPTPIREIREGSGTINPL